MHADSGNAVQCSQPDAGEYVSSTSSSPSHAGGPGLESHPECRSDTGIVTRSARPLTLR